MRRLLFFFFFFFVLAVSICQADDSQYKLGPDSQRQEGVPKVLTAVENGGAGEDRGG